MAAAASSHPTPSRSNAAASTSGSSTCTRGTPLVVFSTWWPTPSATTFSARRPGVTSQTRAIASQARARIFAASVVPNSCAPSDPCTSSSRAACSRVRTAPARCWPTTTVSTIVGIDPSNGVSVADPDRPGINVHRGADADITATNIPTRIRPRRTEPYCDRNHRVANTTGSTASAWESARTRPSSATASTRSIATGAARRRYPDNQDVVRTTALTTMTVRARTVLPVRPGGMVTARETTTRTANSHRVRSTIPAGRWSQGGSVAANRDTGAAARSGSVARSRRSRPRTPAP